MAEKYDVFISFKNTDPNGGLTVDRNIAQRLHDKLLEEGLNVFFSEKDLSDTEFMNQIYKALDEADLLILVGTRPEYVRSKWVKSEWTNFLGAINSGRKPNGKIMTVLSHMTIHDLPLELSNFQSFDASSLDDAVAYAFRTLGRISNSQAREWEKAENERKLKEAEQERLKAVKAQMEAERRERAEKEALAAAQKASEEQKKRLIPKKKAVKHNKNNNILIAVAAVVLLALIGSTTALVLSQSNTSNLATDNTDTYSDWEFQIIDDVSASITAYYGGDTEIIIPETVQGKTVTQIGSDVFEYCSEFTSVTIPASVTSIGKSAFEECDSLNTVNINNLSAWCSIKFENYSSNPLYHAKHLYLNGNNIKILVIPIDVTRISDFAFADCEDLTEVSLHDNVTEIGDCSFEDCSSLISFKIPNSVISVGDSAFEGCSSLTSLTIPDSVTSIGGRAFAGCSGLTSLTIPDSIIEIGIASFSECSGLTSIKIPDRVTRIGSYAFEGCSGLASVTIPHSVISIDPYAFEGCSSLTSVTISDSVTSIGHDAFSHCNNLTVYAPHEADNYGFNLGDYKEWVVR